MKQHQGQERLPAGYKRCTKCNKVKLLGEFNHRRSNRKDGYDWHCRACKNEYRRTQWRRLHPPPSREKLPEGFRRCTKCDVVKPPDDFHRDNRRIDGRVTRCKACMAVYRHQHHMEHLEKDARQARRWQQENPERAAENNRRWQRENPEKARAKVARYRRKNPEKARANVARYHARKAGLLATLTDLQWREILEEWGYRCAYCGRAEKQFGSTLHQEHVIPVSQGGGYTAENIVPSCPQCNSKKSARTPGQAGMDFMPMF